MPLTTYLIYRLDESSGKWRFWMNARGKSLKQVRAAVAWRSKVPISKIKAELCPLPLNNYND